MARGADFHEAAIVLAAGASKPQQKAAQMLAEEVEKRTQLRLRTVPEQRASGPDFVLRRSGRGPAEGFSITVNGQRAIVEGNDDRGVVFGTGYLLRQLRMSRQRLELPDSLRITTSPKVPVRGHQLGYRPKTNAYDGWSVPMWEQYIRELAIFGTNTIELIPPRSDDAADSPHFPLPPMEMMVEMSRIADEYGLDVSIWYPAMDKDYSDPATVEFALKEWAEVFRRLPRIDAVFVPGGDPGHTQPKYLMALLERQAAQLKRFHPHAGMWMSPQSFDQAWMEEFYAILGKQPAWLAGVVYGPQVRGTLADLRARVPKRYPVRFYPDITHSIHAEFPVPDWDYAFAATEGREVINPRPVDEAAIFRESLASFSGFVTYSEGCNDDVNKFVWSGLGWNPEADPAKLLREYSRFFIGDDVADGFAQGLLGLERNWRGPLLTNAGVDVTLGQFQSLEGTAPPLRKLNWRFQEALYRAYYDAYLRQRLIEETRQEQLATAHLRDAPRTGSLEALDAAQMALRPGNFPGGLRARVFELAEALFQGIHMQLSVPRYAAIALGRGANLDAIDFPLNNRVWFMDRFREIRSLDSEADRLAKIGAIVNWTNPGLGGFYDDLGNPAQQPHLLPGAMTGFGNTPRQGWRTSWFTDAETLGDAPLRMRYTDLDPEARYKIRVVYGGDMPAVPLRLTANGSIQIHGFRKKELPPKPVEFDIPEEATRGGTLLLEWSRPGGSGGNGRGCQVSEVWLIRK